MNLPRHTISSHTSPPIFVNAQFFDVLDEQIASTSYNKQERDQSQSKGKARERVDARRGRGGTSQPTNDPSTSIDAVGKNVKTGEGSVSMFACATRQGFFIARTHPLLIVARREFSSIQGGLSHVLPIDNSSLLILVGGGRVPRFAPNKVILWDQEAAQQASVDRERKYRNMLSSFGEEIVSPRASTVFSAEREGLVSSRQSVKLSNSGSDRLADQAHEAPKEERNVGASSPPSASFPEKIQDSSHPAILDDEVDLSMMKDLDKMTANANPVVQSALPLASISSSSSQIGNNRESMRYTSIKGKEVAELEFGEAIVGVCVKTFQVQSTDDGESIKASLMIVLLQSKAVIFEVGPHVQYDSQMMNDNGNQNSPWGIRQRLVVEMQSGLDRGLATMASIPKSNCVLVALPGRQTGHVQVLSLALSNTGRTSIRSSIAGASTIIAAHANPISSLTLSVDGKILCTTSERGTLLRLWSTFGISSSKDRSSVTNLSTSLVCELRRGSDSAKIWSVAFSPDSLLLAVASDKGTIHFFNLRPLHEALYSTPSIRSSSPIHTPSSPSLSNAGHPIFNKKTSRFLPASVQQVANSIPPSILPQYLKSQWSFAQYKIPLKIFSSSIVEDTPRTSQPVFGALNRNNYERMDDQFAARLKHQESLEGNWAGMKGRIEDVRRGEKGIEEGIWLTWISIENSTSSSSSTKQKKMEKKKIPYGSSYSFELIAITSSGNYYRIGVARPSLVSNKGSDSSFSSTNLKKKKSTVLDMYREDNSKVKLEEDADTSNEEDSKQERDRQCWLVEFRKFGVRDDWID